MPIYEYKGQLYELSTNDPAEAKRKIQSSLGEGPSAKEILGGTESSARKIASRAALADTALNAVTGLFDLAARVPATAYEYATGPGGFNEAYERASKNVGQAVQPDFFGRRLGITKTPEYSQALQRQVGEKVSQAIGENVITPVSEATGVHPGAVGDILNIGAMAVAPAVPKVAVPVVQAGKKVITPPIDIAKGLYQGARGVEPGMPGSAVVPLREQYYPQQAVQQFMRNEIGLPELRASQQPSSSLFATAEQQAALRKAETMPGEPNVPLIPVQGQGMRAFGERIGREYVTDPLRAAADVGLSLIAGIPVPISAAQRAMQARQSRTLSQAAQFDPNFRQKLLEAERIEAITPSVAGPVAPQQVRQPQPIPTENQMMLPLTSTITPKAQDFMLTPGPGILGPKQISMQAAAERIQPVLQLPKPTMYSGTQGITGTNLPQVEQANFMAQFPPYPPKPAQKQINQPVAGPVAPQPINRPQPITAPASAPAFRPSNVIKQEINQLDDAATTLREKALSENVKPDTPEGDIYRGELDKLTNNINLLQKELVDSIKLEKELAKKQQKQTNIVQPKTVQPSNVSQMMLERDPNYKQFTLKMPDDIKKGMDTKEGTAAMLSGKGEWSANNYKYKMEEVAGEQTRLQVRKDNQVVYERYY